MIWVVPPLVLLHCLDIGLFLLHLQFPDEGSEFLQGIGHIHVSESCQVTADDVVPFLGQLVAVLGEELALGGLW